MSSSSTVRERVEQPTTDEREGCPECPGSVVQDGDEQICQECGLVVEEDRIDPGPEWRAFTPAEYDERVRASGGSDPAMHDYGLGSEMSATAEGVSGKRRLQLHRMRTWHSRSKWSSKADQNLAQGLGEVKRMGSALGLARDRREQACRLFRTASNQNMILGRSIESMAAASLYAVARVHGEPITLPDVVTVARVGRDRITMAYSALNRELGLPAAPREPALFVPRIASEFGLTDGQRRTATELAGESDAPTSGCSPAGVAAAAVYIAADGVVTQDDVADVAGVSVVTVRSRVQEFPGSEGR